MIRGSGTRTTRLLLISFGLLAVLASVAPGAMVSDLSQWQGSREQSFEMITKLKAKGVLLGKGIRKCAFDIPGEDVTVKIVYCCCPDQFTHCNRQSQITKSSFQTGLAKEVAALVLDPKLKPSLLFYGGADATPVSMERHFSEVARTNGTDQSNVHHDCSHVLGLGTRYILDHIPFVVLKKIQTKPPCNDQAAAAANFGRMVEDFRRHTRPMIVDVDHELSILNSQCQYTFIDFDSACYNHPDNDFGVVTSPFKLLAQWNKENTTDIGPCSYKFDGGGNPNNVRSWHEHVLLSWTQLHQRIKRSPGKRTIPLLESNL